MLIGFAWLPRFFYRFQIGRTKSGERYQSIFVVREIRELKLRLVVTKVTYCGDLFQAVGEASRNAMNDTGAGAFSGPGFVWKMGQQPASTGKITLDPMT